VAPGFLYHVSSAPIAPWSGVQLATPAAGPIEIVLFQGGIVEGRTLEKGTQKPLAGVEVRTLPMALDARVGHGIQPVTTSDAQGRFRLEGVPLGRSSLSARHDTHYLASTGAQGAMPGQWISTPDGMHMVTPGGGGAPALTVFIETEGQRVTRDLELEQGLEIAGKVVGPDGQPAAGAAVMNANQQGEMMFYEGHMTQQRGTLATSDAEGRFTARGLAPSKSLVLVARKAGLIGVRSEPQTLAADAPPKEVVLRLEKGGSLAGQVLDDVGAPAGGVNVQAWPESGDGSWHQAQVLTKADGTFRVEGVGAGSWWVNAWSDDGRHASSRVTGLVAGEAREGVTLKLAKSVQLKGVLVDERGRPVASKMLTSQGTGGGMSQSYSGADGKFTFGGIQAGTQQIYAGDWGSSRLLLGSFEAPASDVRVVWKEPPFGVIEGTVLDAAGRPVPLCSVSIRAGPPAPAAPSGVPMPVGVPMPAGDWGGGQQAVNGWFRQRVGGEPPYQVRVSAPQDTEGRALNLLPTTVTVTDPAGGPLTIRLEPGLEIAGRVLDGSGRGVSDVPVLVGSLRTSTLPDGYFSVGGLTEGTHKVNVQPLPPLVRPPETSATTGTKDLVIRLVTGLPIAGTLRRADGRPVTQGWVNVSWPNSGGTAAGNSGGGVDAQGRFRLEGLPPDALVTVNANVHVQDGPAFAPRTLKDVRPGTENLEIVLGVGAVVSGSVTDAQGRPGKNGSVQLERLADDGKVTSTFQAQLKEDGTFEMGGLEPGPMQVRFVTYDGGAPSETLKIEAPASGVKLVLPERTPIRGRLIGTLGEIGRWQVWAWSVEEPARRVRANITGDGEFSLDGVSGKGPWMVAARAEGDDRYGLAGPLDGGAEGVRLELRTGRSIEGTVQSLSGTPIPTTGLRVMVTMPGFDTRVVTDAQGAFRVRGLPPGRYTLSARGVERAYGEQVKDVADGATGVRLTVK
jgi:protocatechuate 3,4-dioxygenase beta subunit